MPDKKWFDQEISAQIPNFNDTKKQSYESLSSFITKYPPHSSDAHTMKRFMVWLINKNRSEITVQDKETFLQEQYSHPATRTSKKSVLNRYFQFKEQTQDQPNSPREAEIQRTQSEETNDKEFISRHGWNTNNLYTNALPTEQGGAKIVKYVGESPNKTHLLLAGMSSSNSSEFDQPIAVSKESANVQTDRLDPRKSYCILLSPEGDIQGFYANETHSPALAQQYTHKPLSAGVQEAKASIFPRAPSPSLTH